MHSFVWHWSFDPILWRLGPLAVRWYGLMFVAAFLLGQWLLTRSFRAEGISDAVVERLTLSALVGTVVGARLVHCLVYDPSHYLQHPFAILRVWEGGLASHGGLLGLVLGLWMGARRTGLDQPFVWLLDRVAVVAALGGALVRVANFLNSEIVGRPTGAAWGVVFEAVDALPRHPVQLYEAFAYLCVFLFLARRYRRCAGHPPSGLLLGWFLLLVFSARMAMEFFKTPQATYEAGQFVSVGQWLSVPFVLAGVYGVWRAQRRAAPDPKPTIPPC